MTIEEIIEYCDLRIKNAALLKSENYSYESGREDAFKDVLDLLKDHVSAYSKATEETEEPAPFNYPVIGSENE